jgi:hypothetical protein
MSTMPWGFLANLTCLVACLYAIERHKRKHKLKPLDSAFIEQWKRVNLD